jgi:hypothetical protein
MAKAALRSGRLIATSSSLTAAAPDKKLSPPTR